MTKNKTEKPTHTPGPWAQFEYGNGGNGRAFVIETASHNHGLASIIPNHNVTNGISLDEHRANARLIAAAPDLLAALKVAVLVLGKTPKIEAQVRAAIARAEGR